MHIRGKYHALTLKAPITHDPSNQTVLDQFQRDFMANTK